MDDDAFPAHVAERLGGLPCVAAVTLGGSRAEGTRRLDSDWDFSVYHRGHFDPQALRNIGWPGEVFEVGGWSKGVFNGGAWLEIDERRTDVHYRDLDVIWADRGVNDPHRHDQMNKVYLVARGTRSSTAPTITCISSSRRRSRPGTR